MRSLKLLLPLLLFTALAGCSGGSVEQPSGGGGGGGTTAGKVGHVFIIVLENENAETTFGPGSPAAYLSQTLPTMGQFLPNYYGIGHVSLDNYIAMASGQAPNAATQSDCMIYQDFIGAPVLLTDGQVFGQGCVYPSVVKTVANQLQDAGFTWKGYMEDMGNDVARDTTATCSHPALNSRDGTQSASATDQYATRHNPFMYFHAIIDDQTGCGAHVVPLTALAADLAGATPNYVFITPNLCHDGHDTVCANGEPGGLVSADLFLQAWVPQIMASAAYREDGLIIIMFDEAEPVGGSADATSCCGEAAGINTPMPGITGPGGGRVGAVLLSKFITPGTINTTPYNHYSMLRSVEDFFGLEHLGFAGQDGLQPFGPEVFNAGK